MKNPKTPSCRAKNSALNHIKHNANESYIFLNLKKIPHDLCINSIDQMLNKAI